MHLETKFSCSEVFKNGIDLEGIELQPNGIGRLPEESRFNFDHDGNRVSVLRARRERLNPAFAVQLYNAPPTSVRIQLCKGTDKNSCWEELINEMKVLEGQDPQMRGSNHIVFSDDFSLTLKADDYRFHVWKGQDQRPHSVFNLERHTAITPNVKMWSSISYDSRLSVVILHTSLTAQ
ncbi:transposable element Tcb2 transposase [Trichonephila clavipes]|nr:transposable element Tcb2 transposase [Trichonephila clavipes]